jgi:trehalose-phosphatase
MPPFPKSRGAEATGICSCCSISMGRWRLSMPTRTPCTLRKTCGGFWGALGQKRRSTVGVISGRRLTDLRKRLSIAGEVYLAGFHGFEIEGAGETFVHPDAAAASDTMRAIVEAMHPHLPAWPGVFIEDKVLSLALHSRDASSAVRVRAESTFLKVARKEIDAGRLRLLTGACVLELLPDANWHEGRALRWIRERIEQIHGPTFTVYAGDDVTDEDAFRAVGREGITVAASDRASGASSASAVRRASSVCSSRWMARRITISDSP